MLFIFIYEITLKPHYISKLNFIYIDFLFVSYLQHVFVST